MWTGRSSETEPGTKRDANDADGKSGSSPPKRRLLMASDIVSEPLDFVWPGHLARGKVTIWAGDPGVAKSATAVDIAARISTGQNFPGELASARHTPQNVIILSFEDGAEDTIKPRLRAAKADMARIGIYPMEDAPSVTQNMREILADLRRLRPALLIIDPLSSGMTGGVDGHKNIAVRDALRPLLAAAKITGTAVLIIEHLNKNEKGLSALYRLNGSVAFGAVARFVAIAGPDPLHRDDPLAHVLAPRKANLCMTAGAIQYSTVSVDLPADGKEPALKEIVAVRWGGASTATAEDLLTRPRTTRACESVEEARELLRGLLADGPRLVKELEEARAAHGIRPWSWRLAKENLGIVANRAGGNHYTWALPPEDDQDGHEVIDPAAGEDVPGRMVAG